MKNEVFFYGGYQGKPKCQAKIEGKEYVIEIQELEDMLLEMILEKGYTTSKTNKQKYYRLTINK